MRRGEKQANEDFGYQEQNHSRRLRPVERRFLGLGIWESDHLIDKRGRKLEVSKGGKWEKEGRKWLK